MEKTINILESGRADFAYKCAETGSKVKEYKSNVKKLPMLIKTNGLASALSFYYAKSSNNGIIDIQKSHGLILNQIETWLKLESKQLISFEKDKLTQNLLKLESSEYRAVTIEVIAFLTWLRRFADALASDKE